MCGIHAMISTDANGIISSELKTLLSNRGPDHFGQICRELPFEDGDSVTINFTSTVLALRGDHIAKQPLTSPTTGSVLCWNGEAWRIEGQSISSKNDGELILAKLDAADATSDEARESHILNILRNIDGPFAFLFYDAQMKRLYFGRDRLGRRSLLSNQAEDGNSISFSSVADVPAAGWVEVNADGVYSLDLGARLATPHGLRLNTHTVKYDWISSGGGDMVSSIGIFNMALPPPEHKLDFNSVSVETLKHWLYESLKLRVLDIPEPPNPLTDVDIRVAILFSGGIDCTVLARMVHDLVPTNQGIDLINVAFENPRQVSIGKTLPHQNASDIYEACPDRVTGRKAFAELKSACPDRYWRFIAVNVPFEEAMSHKLKIVSLLHPHNTEMDLSIAMALYFAARGTGNSYINKCEWEPTPPSVNSPARVLLSGLGADELFGGYARHEAAFKNGGYPRLIDELKLDISRIGQRNLGRDDRIMSHWGKEVRFPYLDEELVRFAISSPVWEKCDFQNQFHPAVIDPAKRVLRLLADKLGLPIIAREKKRAIQFGSRTAKIESTTGRRRGTAPIIST
ncbi:asparagine synthase-domain-containing protein [Annulohypoxylon maeteangense]|uniref:asparagine synthase-domain-containing protein n=1 Tax=Annulohypoxylon maeteangense TaxID=1927788 RepID=UPI0020075DA6|nr:asparagine synthase-domain-containing protein [Annulohypoxylon maeteangense]KAI0889453.1 asparagine synthase-domain-containing protein [Annulohypoxylon maeteangense]